MDLKTTEKVKLYDAVVGPILNYGSPIWGFHKGPDIERIHLKFMKQILCVRQQTSNAAVYGELGRVPLSVHRKIAIVKFWYRLQKDKNSLVYKLYNMKDGEGNYINEWTLQVRSLIFDLGFNFLWESDAISNLQIEKLVERIYDHYLQGWYSELANSSKLETYAEVKSTFEFEKYLDCITNDKHRVALTRLRCSAHNLEIEEGRYRNIERENRICSRCNMKCVETEYHFLLVCPFYSQLRKDCLGNYYSTWPTKQKLKSLLASTQRGVILKLSKYVYLANLKRNAV